jgi:lipid A 3-O-deacylase
MQKSLLLLFLCFISLSANDTLHALKAGILSHNSGIINSDKDSYIDIHAELLYNNKIFKAYPTVGTEINVNGDTSFAYIGLTWEGKYFKNITLGAFFGAAVHNGNLNDESDSKRKLGTRFLFREALDIAYYINHNYEVSLLLDHYSNGGLGKESNQGNSNIGLRLSYYF